MTITCKAEDTVIRMGLAAVTLRIHHHGDHKTHHHHNGIPGGADEPDGLVQNGKTATREPVSQPLNWASITAFFDGFKPASSVESLNSRRVINECPRCDTINHQLYSHIMSPFHTRLTRRDRRMMEQTRPRMAS